MPTAKERLLGCAAEIIDCIGRDAATITARLRCGGVEIVVMGEPAETEAYGPPMPAPGSNAHWLWLSPLERRVADAATDHWRSAEELAALCQTPNSGEFRAVLRNMVDRNILDSLQSKGYRLKPPPSATSAAE